MRPKTQGTQAFKYVKAPTTASPAVAAPKTPSKPTTPTTPVKPTNPARLLEGGMGSLTASGSADSEQSSSAAASGNK